MGVEVLVVVGEEAPRPSAAGRPQGARPGRSSPSSPPTASTPNTAAAIAKTTARLTASTSPGGTAGRRRSAGGRPARLVGHRRSSERRSGESAPPPATSRRARAPKGSPPAWVGCRPARAPRPGCRPRRSDRARCRRWTVGARAGGVGGGGRRMRWTTGAARSVEEHGEIVGTTGSVARGAVDLRVGAPDRQREVHADPGPVGLPVDGAEDVPEPDRAVLQQRAQVVRCWVAGHAQRAGRGR